MQKMIIITRYHFVTVFPLLCISLHQASGRSGHQCSFTSCNNEEISNLKTSLDILTHGLLKSGLVFSYTVHSVNNLTNSLLVL
jgi:hypothetical protein